MKHYGGFQRTHRPDRLTLPIPEQFGGTSSCVMSGMGVTCHSDYGRVLAQFVVSDLATGPRDFHRGYNFGEPQ